MTHLKKEEEGLRVVALGENPVADIVFVHGLQGHPRNTWLYGIAEEVGKKSRFNLFSRHKAESSDQARSAENTSFFWPIEALAQEFPALRIASYGYNSRVSNFFSGPSDKTTIVGHGRSFLNELEIFRRAAPTRPIIFIVHSLGGLVLKYALNRGFFAQSYESDIRLIYDATRAVLFLGTPHRGSSYADWGVLARNVASAVGFDASDSVVRDLKIDSATLDTLQDDFAKVLREETFWIFTFMETKGYKGLRGLNDKVVPDASAILGSARERKDYIDGNHMEISRFCSKEDNGYRKVKAAIEKSLEGPPPSDGARGPLRRLNWVDQQARILALLRIDDAFKLRYEQVEVAYGESFHWLFTKKELGFEAWLGGEGRLYWIRGLPASGKSTLMKMAYNDGRTKAIISNSTRKRIQAEFFFHDRGSLGQKSFSGLLHAILYQALNTARELIPHVEPAFAQVNPASPLQNNLLPLSVLQSALGHLVQQDAIPIDIYLFLDALDEYAGHPADIATFLKSIVARQWSCSTKTNIKICFSSRPTNDLLDHFDNEGLPGFWMKDHTKGDIEIVVTTMMNRNPRMLAVLQSGDEKEIAAAMALKNSVCTRSEGVFLWVRLVLEDLLQEFTDGKSIRHLNTLIDDLPTDLEQYYLERVIDRIPDRYRTDALTMLDMVRCAIQPLATTEFFTIFLNPHRTNLRSITPPQISDAVLISDLDRLLRSRTGGLLETQKTVREQEIVQFIHLTVKTCVAKQQTRERISKEQSARTNGYEYFTRYCVAVLNDASLKRQHKPTKEWFPETVEEHDFRTLDERFLEHASMAEHITKNPQTEILQQAHDDAISLLYHNPMWCGEMRREPLCSLLDFAVGAELEKFIAQYLVHQRHSASCRRSALRVAVNLPRRYTVPCTVMERRERIITLLLKAGVKLDAREVGLTFYQALWVYPSSSDIDTRCYYLHEQGLPDAATVRQFLEYGQDPDVLITHREHMSKRRWEDRQTSALHIASKEADFEIVKALVKFNANVNSLDSQRQTPLDRASAHLGSRIRSYLSGELTEYYYPEQQDQPLREPAAQLQARLRCISILLDAGAVLSRDPDTDESIYDDYHSDDPVNITQADLDALVRGGLDVDQRIINLPRADRTFMSGYSLGQKTSAFVTKWFSRQTWGNRRPE